MENPKVTLDLALEKLCKDENEDLKQQLKAFTDISAPVFNHKEQVIYNTANKPIKQLLGRIFTEIQVLREQLNKHKGGENYWRSEFMVTHDMFEKERGKVLNLTPKYNLATDTLKTIRETMEQHLKELSLYL